MAESFSRAQWRMIVLASLGGALEFYDFIVYGIFAQYIARAFFPSDDPLVSLVLSFGVFAIGYLARPAGGVILGRIGDRFGRRRVFLVSILVMSGCTLLMAALPIYAQIGVAAPILLLALRLIQGFCLGGELPGSITYVVETVPRHAGLVCGVVFFCVNTGVVLAGLVNVTLQSSLPAADVASYGWRIGFLVGGVIGLGGFWLRRKLEETPDYAAMGRFVARRPLAELLGQHGRAILIGICTTAVTAAFNGLMFAHMPAYLTNVLHYPPTEVAVAQNVCLGLVSVGLLLAGWLGDAVPRRRILALGALLLALGSYPFYLAAAAHAMNIVLLLALAAIPAALVNGTFACVLADMFPTRVRFSGVGIAFNVSFTLFSGTAPLIATWLIRGTGEPAAPATLMAICAAIGFAASFALRGSSGKLADRSTQVQTAA